MAVSQMEPTDARRSFPCFDEPSLKAKFTVTLIADQNLTCLSNMDVASETEVHSKISGATKKAVKFNVSPLMSTYLVAFIVGELNYIESNEFRVPVRVYAPPGHNIEHGRFSLNLAARTLAFYEKVFGIDFPLPKWTRSPSPICPGRHGELGARHLPRRGSPARREGERCCDQGTRCRGSPARAGPPVVRKFGDYGLVGWLVAQRGICDMGLLGAFSFPLAVSCFP